MDLLDENRSLIHSGKLLRQPDTGEWSGWTELFVLLFDNYRTCRCRILQTEIDLVFSCNDQTKGKGRRHQVSFVQTSTSFHLM